MNDEEACGGTVADLVLLLGLLAAMVLLVIFS
jgi:hypothetical protein